MDILNMIGNKKATYSFSLDERTMFNFRMLCKMRRHKLSPAVDHLLDQYVATANAKEQSILRMAWNDSLGDVRLGDVAIEKYSRFPTAEDLMTQETRGLDQLSAYHIRLWKYHRRHALNECREACRENRLDRNLLSQMDAEWYNRLGEPVSRLWDREKNNFPWETFSDIPNDTPKGPSDAEGNPFAKERILGISSGTPVPETAPLPLEPQNAPTNSPEYDYDYHTPGERRDALIKEYCIKGGNPNLSWKELQALIEECRIRTGEIIDFSDEE